MRIKYKTPHNIFFRRFWRVTHWEVIEGGRFLLAQNKAGKQLRLPLEGTIVIFIGETP